MAQESRLAVTIDSRGAKRNTDVLTHFTHEARGGCIERAGAVCGGLQPVELVVEPVVIRLSDCSHVWPSTCGAALI